MVRTFIAALLAALLLAGCGGAASTPFVWQVNGQPIDQAKTCDSYVGEVLTEADEGLICSDPEGTGDLTYVQPLSVQRCDNGEVFLMFSETVAGIGGQKMQKLKPGFSLDRETCTIIEP